MENPTDGGRSMSIAEAADRFRQEVLAFYQTDKAIAGLDASLCKSHLDSVLEGLSRPLPFNTGVESTSPPAKRFWDALAANPTPALAGVVGAGRGCAEAFHWRVNENYRGIFDDHFFDHECFTEVIGPSGLLIADDFRAGFLILGENVHYPDHSHAATELYHPACGEAAWRQGDRIKRDRTPGTPIYHTEWESHAMWTTVPMLALWSWAGDITSEAKAD